MSRFSDFLTRGVMTLADGVKKMRTVQVRLLADEVRDDLEHVEPYGFTSEPHPEAEAFALFFDGDRSHGIVFCVADRRYRLRDLKSGEVALYDDLGQKVVLSRSGIQVVTPLNFDADVGGSLTAVVKGAAKLTCPTLMVDCPQTTFTGNVTVQKLIKGTGGMAISGGSGASVDGSISATGDVKAGTISLQNHVHTGDSGGTTSAPK